MSFFFGVGGSEVEEEATGAAEVVVVSPMMAGLMGSASNRAGQTASKCSI